MFIQNEWRIMNKIFLIHVAHEYFKRSPYYKIIILFVSYILSLSCLIKSFTIILYVDVYIKKYNDLEFEDVTDEVVEVLDSSGDHDDFALTDLAKEHHKEFHRTLNYAESLEKVLNEDMETEDGGSVYVDTEDS
ncbi:hypothetical protein C922_05323 [Plasmodium inui San Antonio 1]|uniref:Uncharacterized protein n=1 Tax=Plasmodium inui San Antonio 1 TaxID=1237626 RepID=W6ZYA3_9APIC|nr:hypothetical protein C922_05323 [Plasmodium inui San Antonio 1]EUD64308.1 hypothetical protein C922_05323 [Plasmodium inui San Antonio 1]